MFRLTGTLQLFTLTAQLQLFGIDDANPTVTYVRLGLCAVRLLHSAGGVLLYGPKTLKEFGATNAVDSTARRMPIGLSQSRP